MDQSRFVIEGMTCEYCEHAIIEALTPLDGVGHVTVSADDGVATVDHNDRFDASGVAAVVSAAGYSLRV